MEKLWLMERQYLLAYLKELEKIQALSQEDFQAFFGNSQEPIKKEILSLVGDKAIITIEGILRTSPLKGYMARYYSDRFVIYQDIVDAVNTAIGNDSIKEIVLKINSPGGDTGMVDNVFQSVLTARNKKTVTAENHGIMASAAFWIASGATKIVSMSATAAQGSIGVMAIIEDYTKQDERYGQTTYKIISKNAPFKNADPKTTAGTEEIQRSVDALERVFINRVAQGRGVSEEKVINDFGKGGMLISSDPSVNKDALDVGMIDAVIVAGAEVKKGNVKTEAKAEQKPKTKKETKTMDLKEFFAENPAEKVKYDAAMATAKKESAEAEKAVYDKKEADALALNKRVGNLLAAKEYPDFIQAMATSVLNGEKSIETLEGAASTFDAISEKEKEDDAKEETKKTGDIKPDAKANAPETGQIKTNAEFDAMIAEEKAKRGYK